MKTTSYILIGLALVLTGCKSATPNYDARFGDAVREAKQKMIIKPNAGTTQEPFVGMDEKAARESVILYQDTFRAPPPAANVINIGGSIGK